LPRHAPENLHDRPPRQDDDESNFPSLRPKPEFAPLALRQDSLQNAPTAKKENIK
jgi:hypothetical protein